MGQRRICLCTSRETGLQYGTDVIVTRSSRLFKNARGDGELFRPTRINWFWTELTVTVILVHNHAPLAIYLTCEPLETPDK